MSDFRLSLSLTRHEDFYLPLKIGKFDVSIQASKAHACEPKETLNDIYLYKTFEVAVQKSSRRVDEPFLTPENEKKLEPFLDYWVGNVAHNVPVEVIEKLLETLKQ